MIDPLVVPTAYTYEDAARVCGVSSETIRLRARRGKLRRGRPTNSNRPTVLLTAADVEAIRSGRSVTGQPVGQSSDFIALADHLTALTNHVTTLKEQLQREQERADRAEARANKAEQGADAAGVQVALLQTRFDSARIALQDAAGALEGERAERVTRQRALAEAEAALVAFRQAETSWQARGLLTRMLAALRGSRRGGSRGDAHRRLVSSSGS